MIRGHGALASGAPASWIGLRRLADQAGLVLGLLVALPALALVPSLPLPHGGVSLLRLPWAPGLGAELALRLDGLAAAFVLLVSGIGALVLVYAGAALRGHARRGEMLALLTLFTAAMLGLVVADNLVLLFVFWELTSLTSFLLVGWQHEEDRGRRAARQALVVTVAGGLALLAGLLLLGGIGVRAGLTPAEAMTFSGLLQVDLRGDALYPAAFVLVALGAFTKSAQVPLHFWLPAAMAAPTAASALLHSATMVKAGVYLLARLAPGLGGTLLWEVTLITAGAATMVLGALLAAGQRDLKRMLAYSTVSVLGTLVLLLGAGTRIAIEAMAVFLCAHALYKAALFMVVGNVDKASGVRDVTRLGGLGLLMPLTALAGILAALSKAGAPPMFGFLGKELLYKAKLEGDQLGLVLIGFAVLTNLVLVALALLVGIKPFVGRRRDVSVSRDVPVAMGIAPLLLGLGGLFVGLVPGAFDARVGSGMASAVLGRPVTMELKLWHGLSVPALTVLVLSALTLAGGFALYGSLRPRLAGVAARAARLEAYGPARAFERAIDAAQAAGRRLAAASAPAVPARALALVLLLAILAAAPPAWIAVQGLAPAGFGPLTPDLLLAALLVIAGAGLAIVAPARIAGLAGVGLAGFGVALVFLQVGGPDLALTQLLVEALLVLLLVAVLRELPRARPRLAPSRRWLAGVLGGGAGVMAALAVLAAAGVEPAERMSAFYGERSVSEAFGRNVVNVILVDFRAFDTLGEVLVVACAGLGIAMLVPRWRGAPPPAGETSLVLRVGARFVGPLLAIAAVVLLVRGHNEPGGGFIAGLVATGVVALHMLAYGAVSTRQVLRLSPQTLIAAGLLTVIAAALAGPLAGRPLLSGLWLGIPVPVVGKLGTPLLFDLGVALVVCGAAFEALLRLGEDSR